MPFVQLSSKAANASKSGGQKETIPLQDICNTSGSSQRSPKHSVSLPMQTKKFFFFVICRFILLVHDFVLMVVIDMCNNNKNKVLVEYIIQNSNQ